MATRSLGNIHPKVYAGTIGASVAVLLEWVYTSVTHNDIPNAVDGALIVLLTFLFGYFVPGDETVVLPTNPDPTAPANVDPNPPQVAVDPNDDTVGDVS